MIKKLLLLYIIATAFASVAAAQVYTAVTGTITDPNGLPYSGATINIQLAPAPSGPARCGNNTLQILGTTDADKNGFFQMALCPNASITPAGSQWQFNVSINPGIVPPAGTGPQQCAPVLITIAGASQNVSATVSAGCPALSNITGGSSPAFGAIVSGTNNSATMVVGSGASLAPSGSGVITPSTGPAGGTPGQVLVSNGGSPGTYQDPNVSNAPMVLLSAVAATATQTTSSAVKIPIQSALGTLVVTGSGITGSPVGCTVALELQQSTGAPASAAVFTQAFTPASSYQSFTVSPTSGFASGDNMLAVYACGTYPTGGTITVTFNPQYASPSPSNGGFSQGIWVTTSDVLWAQFTSQGLSSASTYNAYRILQPSGQVTNGNWAVSCSGGSGGLGTGLAVPVNGWLQMFTSQMNPGGGLPQGSVFVNHYILTSMPTGGGTGTCVGTLTLANQGVLLDGANTGSFYPVGYPMSGIQSPWQTPPYASAIGVSSPSAGTDWSQTSIGSSSRTCINGVFFQLTTSATVANRQVAVRILNGSTPQWFYIATIQQPASTTVQYSFAPGTMPQQQTIGGTTYQTVPFANGYPICGNAGFQLTVQSLTGNLQAADQYSFIGIGTYVLNDNN